MERYYFHEKITFFLISFLKERNQIKNKSRVLK